MQIEESRYAAAPAPAVGAWLLKQTSRGGFVGQLAAPAATDRRFPKNGDPRQCAPTCGLPWLTATCSMRSRTPKPTGGPLAMRELVRVPQVSVAAAGNRWRIARETGRHSVVLQSVSLVPLPSSFIFGSPSSIDRGAGLSTGALFTSGSLPGRLSFAACSVLFVSVIFGSSRGTNAWYWRLGASCGDRQ